MSSQLAWEVVPTPRVGNSPVPIQHQETPVIHKSKPKREKMGVEKNINFGDDFRIAWTWFCRGIWMFFEA